MTEEIVGSSGTPPLTPGSGDRHGESGVTFLLAEHFSQRRPAPPGTTLPASKTDGTLLRVAGGTDGISVAPTVGLRHGGNHTRNRGRN